MVARLSLPVLIPEHRTSMLLPRVSPMICRESQGTHVKQLHGAMNSA